MKALKLIRDQVCLNYGVSAQDIISGSRKRPLVIARHIAMYVSSILCPHASLKSIGSVYGNRGHTTVIHAKKSVENDIEWNKSIKDEIGVLMSKLRDVIDDYDHKDLILNVNYNESVHNDIAYLSCCVQSNENTVIFSLDVPEEDFAENKGEIKKEAFMNAMSKFYNKELK